ncbi:hypothetical protein GCM10010912_16810 [Paenibacillus albidus]|uniref:Uncharacterized protein n=1 Tax=Paenibacillus albidus TaxID=2041023 RepID=A0A917FFA0_9BACL|nr:hypothetical protein GCM10010912_16810 [Paenibacillus albidus]
MDRSYCIEKRLELLSKELNISKQQTSNLIIKAKSVFGGEDDFGGAFEFFLNLRISEVKS